jgi:hypothetical protein
MDNNDQYVYISYLYQAMMINVSTVYLILISRSNPHLGPPMFDKNPDLKVSRSSASIDNL